MFVLGMMTGAFLAVVIAAIYTFNKDRKDLAEHKFDRERELVDEGVDEPYTADSDIVEELVEHVNVLTEAFRALNSDVANLYELFDDEGEADDSEPVTIYPGEELSDEDAQRLGGILKEHIDRRKSTTGS